MESIDVPTIYEVPFEDARTAPRRSGARQTESAVGAGVLTWTLGGPSSRRSNTRRPKSKSRWSVKYTELPDAYKSISESFIHAGAVNDCKGETALCQFRETDRREHADKLGSMAGILVAPGSANRGIEGKIEAVHFARVNNIPFWASAFGMQCAVIEFARNVLGTRMPIRARWSRRPIRSSTSWRSRKALRPKAARCVWEPIPVRCAKGRKGCSLRQAEYFGAPPPPLRVQRLPRAVPRRPACRP